MKILFLDIDGVLNTDRHPTGNLLHEHDPQLVRNVQSLVRNHTFKVVLSSAWRLYHTLEEMLEIWKDHGWVDVPLIGKTPRTQEMC